MIFILSLGLLAEAFACLEQAGERINAGCGLGDAPVAAAGHLNRARRLSRI
jgi:hypothetical protein